jgi:hypothetical protein
MGVMILSCDHPHIRLGPFHALREPGEAGEDGSPLVDEDLETGEGGQRIVCRSCRSWITSSSARMRVGGRHRHVFCNPHGFVFEIGCFAFAPGCRSMGVASEEFSWFPGFSWRIVVCAACRSHLGWCYLSGRSEGGFFGLILDHLVEEEESGE